MATSSVSPSDRPEPSRSDFVQSLARGLSVIQAFDAEHPELTLSQVALATSMTRAAARRFLLTLQELGFVRLEGRQFALTARVLELGFSYLSSLSLPDVAHPHMRALVSAVEETSSLAVLDVDAAVYVARVPSRRVMTVTVNVGTRFPAHSTAVGRVLLSGLNTDGIRDYVHGLERIGVSKKISSGLPSELARVRAQGWDLVDHEAENGLRTIAVPIRDRSGRVVAALNIATPAYRIASREGYRRQMLPALVAAAARIESDLSSGPTSTAASADDVVFGAG